MGKRKEITFRTVPNPNNTMSIDEALKREEDVLKFLINKFMPEIMNEIKNINKNEHEISVT